MPKPIILDKDGQAHDWAWLTNKFGAVSLSQSAYTEAWRLVRIQERPGHSSHVVTLIDADGIRVSGITVIRYWPDAPKLPEWTPPPERWFNRGVHGETNAEGNIGFGMGRGDQYYPPAAGAASAWVGELGVGSDCFNGLGWIVHPEDNDLHLDITFQRLAEEPPPAPPDFETEVLECLHAFGAQLDAIIALLQEMLAHLQGG